MGTSISNFACMNAFSCYLLPVELYPSSPMYSGHSQGSYVILCIFHVKIIANKYMYVNTEMSTYLPIHPSSTYLPVNTYSCLQLFFRIWWQNTFPWPFIFLNMESHGNPPANLEIRAFFFRLSFKLLWVRMWPLLISFTL